MKKHKHVIGTMVASIALATAAMAAAGSVHADTSAARPHAVPAGSAAGAAEAAAHPHCAAGKVCMWSEPHFQGHRYDWSPNEGNVFLGDHELADKVASFVATVEGCFQDSPPPGPGAWRKFKPNDFQSDYEFGRRTDRIVPGC
ncbi:peptidase inhibitor family I36 protein [Streptomyces sp. NPDC047070]|uniref:peptidase inhibitor family I36 protein n=1 Tax=Streptomyces sp. NPDC047070 TaxID=3154923 RepID=UPI0034557454